MISTVLVSHPSLVRVLFWVVVVMGALLGWFLHRARKQRALAALSLLSLLGLLGPLALTLSPSSAAPEAFCAVQFSMPFQGIKTLANLAMLLPLALFAALFLRRPLLVSTAAAGMSALIELTQALMPALGRSCDTNDWFMNTVGAVFGALLATCIIAWTDSAPSIPWKNWARNKSANGVSPSQPPMSLIHGS